MLMACALCACGKEDETTDETTEEAGGDVLQGTWKRHDEDFGDIELKIDGKGGCTFSYSLEDFSDDVGSYKLDSDTDISVKLESWEDYQTATYKVEGNKLTISDNYSVFGGEYTK